MNTSKTSKIIVLAALAIMMLCVTGCGSTRIGPGHVGLEVSLAGGNRGVQDIPIRTGWVFYNPITTDILEYPTFVQTAKWTKSSTEGTEANEELTFKSKEGVIVAVDISLSYQLDATKAPHFYVKYRSDDLKLFTHGVLRNIARDAFNEIGSTYGVDDLSGAKLGEFVGAVKDKINSQVAAEGIHIEQFGFLEAPRLPDSYQQAMLAKQTATQNAQQKENELRATQADAAKTVAAAEGEAKARIARADGEATANLKLASSVTDKLLMLRKLDIQQRAVEKWNGTVPNIQGGGSGTGGGSLNIIVPLKEQ